MSLVKSAIDSGREDEAAQWSKRFCEHHPYDPDAYLAWAGGLSTKDATLPAARAVGKLAMDKVRFFRKNHRRDPIGLADSLTTAHSKKFAALLAGQDDPRSTVEELRAH